MFDTFSQFHFIRPFGLLALLPLALAIGGLMMKNRRKNQWLNVIDKNLLKHLLVGQQTIKSSTISPFLFLSLSLILAVLALAGPTWQKQPLPVFETEISKVIILDLSLSMKSTDIKPDRLTRAKHKITDILSRTKEGQVALIVYAGDAFVISPLTTDANTIATMIPPLSPSLMPVLGSEPQNAFTIAGELLVNAGVFSGQIIWITDGIDNRDYGFVSKQISNSRHQISILAVGTSDGAPIPLPDGQGFLKDIGGNIILPAMNIAPLAQLADMGSGSITKLAADDSDIDLLLSSFQDPEDFISSEDDLEMDRWVEFGPWLLIPVIFVVAFAFRKGVVVALLLTLFPVFPEVNAAEESTQNTTQLQQQWENLWQTPDQQAITAYKNKDHKTAADLFQQKDWKSAALYKSGQFNAASDLLSTMDTATAHYNRGNALAYGEQLEAAIASYERALEQSPDMEDAAFNKSIVEEMLKQQQEQEKQDQDQEQQDQQQDGEQQESDQESDQDGEQQESDEQEDGQQEQQEGQEEQENNEQQGEQQQSELEKMSDAEKEQVLEQWLRQIKDDPGGLLRRKMYMEYQR
ncbi:MAG: VWA domain-containing protein, partial [Gammaproteobacteria bacterium]|nr:VWA domain-containing protein [Gammaproteobacteria bacterium]